MTPGQSLVIYESTYVLVCFIKYYNCMQKNATNKANFLKSLRMLFNNVNAALKEDLGRIDKTSQLISKMN